MHRSTAALLTLSICLTLGGLLVCGCDESQAREPGARVDLVLIDTMNEFGSLERRAVQFPHDMHTEAIADGLGCEQCHLRNESGLRSPLYLRLAYSGYA
jgi:hypothetical protein